MTKETAIKREIKDYLNTCVGVFWWYNLAGLGAYPGLPDLFAVKDGKIYGIEVKTSRGRQSPAQLSFEEEFRLAGGIYILAHGYEDVEKYL